MSRICMKCDHVAMGSPDACPSCGAIYSKVEEALAKGRQVRPARSSFGDEPLGTVEVPPVTEPRASGQEKAAMARLARSYDDEPDPFIKLLRRESNYPTFRSVVGVFFWIGVFGAVGVALIALFKAEGAVMLGTLVGALVMLIVLGFMREASLMLADLSDAAVRMAEREEERRSP